MDSKVVKTAARKPPNAGKGRKKGVPNKNTANLKNAIMHAFEQVGGKDYLVKVAEEDQRTFCTLLGKVLPSEIQAQLSSPDGGPINLQVSFVASQHT